MTNKGREAVALAKELKPGVAVLDMTMPELSGLEAVRQIRCVSPQTEVLVFSPHNSEDVVPQVFDVGAKNKSEKPIRPGI